MEFTLLLYLNLTGVCSIAEINTRSMLKLKEYRRSLTGNREMINVYDKGAGSIVFHLKKGS
jgi:hypothetical protein